MWGVDESQPCVDGLPHEVHSRLQEVPVQIGAGAEHSVEQEVVGFSSAKVAAIGSAAQPACVPTPFGRRSVPSRPPAVVDVDGTTSPRDVSAAASFDGPPQRKIISLCDVLGDACPAQEATLHFPVPSELPECVFSVFTVTGFSQDIPDSVKIHPAAATLLEHLCRWDRCCPFEALLLYIDGSYKQGEAAWAVTGFVLVQGQWQWAGYLAASLDARFQAGSAFEAELMAQFVANCVVACCPSPAAVHFDSTAAAAAAEGRTSLHGAPALAHAVAAVAAYLYQAGKTPYAQHVSSHNGNPANELADSLAKGCLGVCGGDGHDIVAPLVESILAFDLDWLWVRGAASAAMPRLDADGDTIVAPVQSVTTPTVRPSLFAPAEAQVPLDKVCCPLRLASYNVLSAKAALQRQCLHTAFKRQGLSVLALQETKHATEPRRIYDGVLRLSGPCQDGSEGVALWFNLRDGQLPWTQAHITVTFAADRLLSALVSLPGVKLMFFSGHAYPATAPDDCIDRFWGLVRDRLRSLPSDTAPVLLFDANARFQNEGAHLCPLNRNARHWLRILDEFGLGHTGTTGLDGVPLYTWTSPTGRRACLDYIAFPAIWSGSLQHVGTTEFLDEFAGIDHAPLLARFDLSFLPRPPRARTFDIEALHTSAGRQTVAEIFAAAPIVPWEVQVDDHLQQLNAYFQAQLQERFAAPQDKLRHPALSKDTWALLRHKRMTRRRHRFRRQLEAKQHLCALFVAWKARVHNTPGPDLHGLQTWVKAVDRRASLHGREMRILQARINAAYRKDMAAFTRSMWQEARAGGPAELARTLRAVLKAGRSYKPPRVDVALQVQGALISDPAEISAIFGRAFAVSEQAVEVDFAALQGEAAAPEAVSARFVAHQMPSVATLAASFSALNPRKAAGLSRLPPDFYAAHPLGAAMTHAPLILKTLARSQVPVLWGGCLSRPLLKPGKRPDDPKSYRAIALQEPASKAAAKAVRPHLCACFESIALPSIGGARPGFALNVPALTVQAALACAQRDKRSIGVLFLDGVAAFYATSRASLFAYDRDELQAQLRQGPFDHDVVEAFLAFLPERGALETAGVSPAVVASLQNSMSKTWYTTSPDDTTVYRTSKGTVPGAPLADLLFQYVLHAAVSALDLLLRRSGLAMAVTHGSVQAEAEPCSWLDDLTVLVQSETPGGLAHATICAARLAHQCLGLIGIEVNYSPRKTEALLQWRGRGSRTAREQVLG